MLLIINGKQGIRNWKSTRVNYFEITKNELTFFSYTRLFRMLNKTLSCKKYTDREKKFTEYLTATKEQDYILFIQKFKFIFIL